VEGAKTEVNILKRFFKEFDIVNDSEIFSYQTNIFSFLAKLEKKNIFLDNFFDLLLMLKEFSNSKDKEKLSQKYTDIILIFDYEPHILDEQKQEQLLKLQEYCNNVTENGKLYLSYPMIEAIEDKEYLLLMASFQSKDYKKKFKNNIRITKDKILEAEKRIIKATSQECCLIEFLKKQNNSLNQEKQIFILSTVLLYFLEEYPHFIKN
jgi:hypothetical protein